MFSLPRQQAQGGKPAPNVRKALPQTQKQTIRAKLERLRKGGGQGGTAGKPPAKDGAGPPNRPRLTPVFNKASGANIKSNKINQTKKIETKEVGSYNPINKGPLPDDIAKTFRSGTYSEKISGRSIIMYRVISNNGNPTGNYWTRTKPRGPLQSVMDSALDQKWVKANSATRVVKARIPPGTNFFEGHAEGQGNLPGGGNQVYIKSVNKDWILSDEHI